MLDVRNSNAASFWIGLISDKFKLKFFVGKIKRILSQYQNLRNANFAAVSEAHFILASNLFQARQFSCMKNQKTKPGGL